MFYLISFISGAVAISIYYERQLSRQKSALAENISLQIRNHKRYEIIFNRLKMEIERLTDKE